MTAPQILGGNSPRNQPGASPVIGWHYDYQLRCGAIANGAQTPEIELQIEPGAPFCLRGIGAYNVANAVGNYAASELAGAFLEYTDSQDNWLQTTLIGTNGDWPTGGFNAQYEPVYNQLVYGPGSVLSVRLANLSGANWQDARIVFRGTKLYYKERVYNRCYPPCYSQLPWEQVLNLTFAGAGNQQSIPVQAKGADIVIRGANIAFDSPSDAGDFEVLIQGQDEFPYANDYIHWAWLFPQNLANRPGIWYPEIYVPKDRMILVNAQQINATELNPQISFVGARIWPK
jgi:hypothetical protein